MNNFTFDPNAIPFLPINHYREPSELLPSFLLDNDIDKYFT